MMTFKRTSIFQWLIAALAFAPLLLFAYLGQFSRMMADDYCIAAGGQELGAWDGMLYWYRNWSGAYSTLFLKGAMAPLDTLLPRVTPTIIIVLWLVGLSWLVFQCLACLGIGRPRRALSISIASLTVATTIHAFYSPQSFYWFSSSTQTALSLALLTIYMALALWTAQQWRGGGGYLNLLGIIAGGLLCFISAGMYEMFVVFQTTFLMLCLLAIFAFLRSSVRRSYALVFGVGWLATLGGLAIQLSSPGVALRAAYIVQTYGQPNRSIPTIISETLTRTLGYIGHPQALVGFIMLMGVGLLVMLIQYRPQATLKTLKPVKLALPPLWIGLGVQLIFIPILWQHTSDHPQLLERFSTRYMTVIILNIIFILGFLALLWRRKTINAKLQQLEHGVLIGWYTVGFTLAAVLFAFMPREGIHYRASIYLITSFLVFLIIIIWQLLSVNQTPSTRSCGFLALYVYATGAVCIAAIVGVVLFGRGGFVAARTLAPGAYLLVLPGLIWGAYLGYLIKNHPPRSQAGQAWIRLFKLISLAIVLIIGMGIVLGQAALAPDFQLYAKEWDARHQEIITMRDSGQTAIEIAPLTFDLTKYVGLHSTWAQFPTNSCSKRYYGVDSIIASDG